MYFFWDNTAHANPDTRDTNRRLTIVVGSGLIGSSTINAIKNSVHQPWDYQSYAFPWSDRQAQQRVLESIHHQMKTIMHTAESIEVIWSAGKVGFSCTKAAAQSERSNFKTVIAWLSELQNKSDAEITINLISSLGGLFEMANVVQHDTQPKPARAYGHLKLEQEQVLQANSNLAWRIYRVSSAYGPIAPHHRMGLIPTLIFNAYKQKSTLIYGHLDTRRDYVWVDDVTQYIVRKLHTQSGKSEVQSLASYESFSISDIKHKVEGILQQKLDFTFNNQPDNGESILISPSLRPIEFQTSNLENNIKKIQDQWLLKQP